jgi:hypothetical protein
MKLPASLAFIILLCCTIRGYGQSNSFVIRLRSMQATSNLSDDDRNKDSFGLNLGYGKMIPGNHFGYDVTGFADFMNYNYYFDDNKRFEGTTLYTGLALSPHYTFNPQNEVQFSAGFSLKVGYNWGYGSVKEYSSQKDDYRYRLERKVANGGYSVAFAPMVSVSTPFNIGTVGLELGYDSSNFGQGINKLRSTYYPPLNYRSGYLFLGVFIRLHH